MKVPGLDERTSNQYYKTVSKTGCSTPRKLYKWYETLCLGGWHLSSANHHPSNHFVVWNHQNTIAKLVFFCHILLFR